MGPELNVGLRREPEPQHRCRIYTPQSVEKRRREEFFTNPPADFEVRLRELDALPGSFYKQFRDLFPSVSRVMQECGRLVRRSELAATCELLRAQGIAARHLHDSNGRGRRISRDVYIMTKYDYELLTGKPYFE